MPTMADPAELLQRIYVAGFELETFERFPRALGIVRGDCVAIVVPDGRGGLQMLGAPGWKMAGGMGVQTTVAGNAVFQWKAEVLPATAERLATLRQFATDLRSLLGGRD